MQWQNSKQKYGAISIGLHWLMAILLVAVYACIELREFYPKGSGPREAMKSWHFMLGLTVFILVWLRLLPLISGVFPKIEPKPPAFLQLPSRLMHLSLYALMIAMPLLGWLLLSAAGKPIPFFGLELPTLISESKSAADYLKEIHESGGTIGYFLIGLHTTAALFHDYILGDNTMRRMLGR